MKEISERIKEELDESLAAAQDDTNKGEMNYE